MTVSKRIKSMLLAMMLLGMCFVLSSCEDDQAVLRVLVEMGYAPESALKAEDEEADEDEEEILLAEDDETSLGDVLLALHDSFDPAAIREAAQTAKADLAEAREEVREEIRQAAEEAQGKIEIFITGDRDTRREMAQEALQEAGERFEEKTGVSAGDALKAAGDYAVGVASEITGKTDGEIRDSLSQAADNVRTAAEEIHESLSQSEELRDIVGQIVDENTGIDREEAADTAATIISVVIGKTTDEVRESAQQVEQHIDTALENVGKVLDTVHDVLSEETAPAAEDTLPEEQVSEAEASQALLELPEATGTDLVP